MPKIRPLLVEKYDITQKIFSELSHLESRYILFSIINKPKRAQEISKELKIPMSSVYKRINSLKDCALIYSKTGFEKKGYVVTRYQSMIKDAKINIKKFEPSISFTKNPKIENE